MTDNELKNLSDSELLEIIDTVDIDDPNFKQISQLAKVDGKFRARMYQLKAENKSDSIKSRQELIKALEDNIKSAPEAMKPHLQATLDRLAGKIQDSDFEEFINN
jgi:DNA-binding GntR family transcriptional regulator